MLSALFFLFFLRRLITSRKENNLCFYYGQTLTVGVRVILKSDGPQQDSGDRERRGISMPIALVLS
jgi:hypothetical protein